ncbi:hypothetical protein EV586_10361 [Tumebacillus sp. BK434]|uniref:hypothetical protein n=1 Tax=Tumebacillus sp. BK434 TaxID=2512169 RepID=UPI00105022B5|nr:hypothetical protein [Tumebacillus sp. BK434]TCP55409.1 hypothetical protein EV586_10361 [Tumebacillus sp. BK434]
MMKKALSTLLITAMCVTALTGCGDKKTEENNAPNDKPQTTTPDLNGNQGNQGNQGNGGGTGTTGEGVPESTEASHKEIKEAFGLTGFKMVSPLHLSAIALGKFDLGIDEPHRLALATAISAAMAEINWQQDDLPPGIFLSGDASEFAIGAKHKNGELLLNRYKLEGEQWKKISSETKQGK